ncbi:peroxidase family protein [Actinocrispum wychmicini]|uniref:peroxidase family protein n=1 Tax=Actinocrispum wychmicini TaxID=1213861 RepID=UPI0014045540|nr:peroxidase family protein [Actinocrispum wychmicini]
MRRSLLVGLAMATVVAVVATANPAQADDGGVSDAPILGIWEAQSLNGVNNNPNFPSLGAGNTKYLRIGPTRYADGLSQMVSGPNARAVSNRIFNDMHINVFSDRGVTQWGNVWGQFVDHNMGHRDEAGTKADIPFNANDPMESFRDTLGVIPFNRSVPAPGTGVNNARQQLNTENSFLDGEAVYGPSDGRLDWLRSGSVDGNPDNNSATLMMPNNYLPRADSRGNASAAPTMAVDGRLLTTPGKAVVAGDVRANEQALLTSVQTLFAREHNRIVAALPRSMSQEDKFQLARAVVIAEIQNITYNEFLPAMGVSLPSYQGYDPNLDPSTAHEFATVGYRAHSFIHGEMETTTNLSRYSQATLDALKAAGVEVTPDGANVDIAVPDNLLFFNPNIVEQIQLGPIMTGITGESDYRNDETIDNQLRSILFQVPTSSNPDCLDGPTMPQCFSGVVDLGAIDLQRGRDHGMPTYNQMRNSYGLSTKTSFTAITGESTDSFPADPLLTPGNEINDPNCLDVVALFDIKGNPTTVAADNATRVVRRCTVAARLKALYGSVSNLDAFTGMLAEKHLTGSELGELQMAIWKDQFGAARDGDRFFYLNDPLQDYIRSNFGIDSHRTLAQVIAANTDVPATQLPANVFRLPGAPNVSAGLVGDSAADAVAPAPDATPAAVATSSLTRHDSRNPSPANKSTPQSAITGQYPIARQLHRRPRRCRTAG